jgi:hypothetical protein
MSHVIVLGWCGKGQAPTAGELPTYHEEPGAQRPLEPDLVRRHEHPTVREGVVAGGCHRRSALVTVRACCVSR